MASNRQQVISLLEHNAIAPEKVEQALVATEVRPQMHDWLKFLDRTLLWLGTLSLVFSVLFFIAYNWAEMGRFAKFALVEVLLVLSVIAYYTLYKIKISRAANSSRQHSCTQQDCIHQQGSIRRFNSELHSGSSTTQSSANLGGQAAGIVQPGINQIPLFVAAILLGVLLALFGQTYQTGADPWQLFFNWALLVTPWVIVSRFAPLWVLWLALLNVAASLYHMNFRGDFGWLSTPELNGLWHAWLLNTLAIACWEYFSRSRLWMKNAWSARLIAIYAAVPITILMIGTIVNFEDFGWQSFIGWSLWLLAMYWGYIYKRQDLFMVALALVSVNLVIISFLVHHLLSRLDGGAFLFIGMSIIAMAASSAVWLRKLNREWQQ
ncbi:DUF2157 domain-containing protein [Shewanella sp. WXL01]|uniref:DUF2157 domain-containing protein n=1 Tax=Shewanella sp. WXL01 TaxID=2709721 RepID=UPI0014386615|nr:DUF2157 domain-containing protein [Shewanella sp. WXL01]NKF49176.1 DUF2157 domain-containing protein [Shewanella sp. WXL01]